MAEGAWVPAFDSLWKHPKTADLAKSLHTSVDVAGAKFLRLCSWARDHASTGDLSGLDPEVICRAVALDAPTDRRAERVEKGMRFLAALGQSGFLTGEKLHIKGWEDGPGKLVAARARDRDRQAEKRDRERRDREVKARADLIADARQARIDEARGASGGGFGRPTPQKALPHDIRTDPPKTLGNADSVRGTSDGHPEAPATPSDAVTSAPLPHGFRTASAPAPRYIRTDTPESLGNSHSVRGRGTTERDNPLPLTGRTRGRGSDRPPGRPDCGGCRDPFFVHRSQAREAPGHPEGDCAACATRGERCEGYTAKVLDPEIPDEVKA